MSNHSLSRIFAALLTAAMMLASLSGCGAKTEESQSASAASAVSEAAPNPPAAEIAGGEAGAEQIADVDEQPAEAAETAVQQAEDGAFHVQSVEELLEAIRPQASIVMEPGRYNLTEFLANYPNPRDFDLWNEAHEYVQINDAFDGLELVVKGVNDLSITGGSDDPAATEIVIEPRHATVLGFTDCTGIELACLTMGHTDGAECSGDVLDFYHCRNIRLRTMDLYGCGAYGITAMDGCGDMLVSNSTIRDCSYGPFAIYTGEGEFRFTACTLSGSEGGGDYGPESGSSLVFDGCAFGLQESNRWYFDNDVTCENCQWSSPTEYPDVDPGYADY